MSGAAALSGARRRWKLLTALIAAGALLAILVALWDWNWLKGPVERRAGAITGREFQIRGDLDVDLGSLIVVRANALSMANAEWSDAGEMLRIERLRADVPFWPLLRGRRILQRLDLVKARVQLERDAEGRANWRFERDAGVLTGVWEIGAVRVEDGRLEINDVPLKTAVELRVTSDDNATKNGRLRLNANGNGRFRGRAFRLVGWADSPADAALRRDAEWRVDLVAHAGATRGRAFGSVPLPFDPRHFNVNAELSGEDLEELYPMLGLAVPSTPPYRVRGRLERDGQVVRMRRFAGRVGDSDIAGSVAVDFSGDKASVVADLVSPRLDIDDLGGLIGLPPDTEPGETASAEQREEARRRAASPRILPDDDFDLHKLNAVNAVVSMRADRVDGGRWPIQSMQARMKLRDGLLRIDPLDFGFADGRVTGAVELNAKRSPIETGVNLDVREVDLARLWPTMQPGNVGQIGGDVDLHGHGNSVATMLGTSNGDVQLAMGTGRFSNLLLEMAGLDVAETLKFLLTRDKTVPLRCAYAVVEVQDGVAKARKLVFDTTDTVIFGRGSANLANETLALEITPKPKDVSPLALRGPLDIEGTFKDPEFRPKAKPLLGRAVAAAALYAITPPAALLAFIETGPGDDAKCGNKAGS